MTAGIAPDLDYTSYFAGPGAFLRFHRTALHSIGGTAVMSCALAGVFCALNKRFPHGELAKRRAAPLTFAPALALCAMGVTGHDLLDLVSGEGIQLLWPFRVHWSRWNLAAGLDPWVLILLIAALLMPQLFRLVAEEVGARKKKSGGGAAVAALLLIFTYFGARVYLHSRAVDLLLSSEYHGREPLSAGAFPSSFDPFSWRGIVSTDNTLEEIEVDLRPGADFNPDHSLTHYKPAGSPALEAADESGAAQRFLAYVEFPLARVTRRENGYRFEVRDLRFPANDQSPANMAVRVDLNSSSQIIHEEIRYASSGND